VPRNQKAQVDAETRLRERKAVDLVLSGASYEQVAEQCGYTNKGTAWHAVHRLLAREDAEGAEQLRNVQGAQIERLLQANWQYALAGDLKAGQFCLQLLARQARLFGLDKPIQVEITDQDAVNAQIASLSAELGMLAGDAPVPVE
jgi:transposase